MSGLLGQIPGLVPQSGLTSLISGGGGGFDPQTAALLAAAFQGLQASGPSRTPQSLGQIIGGAGAAGMNAYEQAMQMAQKKKQTDALIELEKQKIEKMKRDSAMSEKLMGLLGADVSGQGMNADKLDQLGAMLSLQLHPGGGVLTNLAERVRKSEDAKSTMGLLRSQPASITETPTFGVNQGGAGMRSIIPQDAPAGQIPPEVMAASQAGKPFSIGVGQSVNPAENVQRVGGLFANDMQSQDPAQAQQGLLGQQLVDQASGRSANPQHFIDMQARLAAAAAARQQQVLMANMAVANRAPQAGVSVIDPNTHQPTIVAKGKDIGMTPANATTMGGLSGMGVDKTAIQGLKGEELLNALPAGVAQEVKQRASGDRIPPTGFALKSPYFQDVMQLVQQYDSTYNDRRYSVKQEYLGKGPTKNTLTNLNQAVMHSGTLYELDNALQNGDIQLGNRIVNFLKQQTGRTDITNVSIAQQVLGEELMRTFRGSGAGSEKEATAFDQKLQSTIGSPEQQKGVLKTVANLLNGRLKVMGDQYVQGMGSESFRKDLLVPSAQEAFKMINGNISAPSDIRSQADAILNGTK